MDTGQDTGPETLADAKGSCSSEMKGLTYSQKTGAIMKDTRDGTGIYIKKLAVINGNNKLEFSPSNIISCSKTELSEFVANIIELAPLLPTTFNQRTDCSCVCPVPDIAALNENHRGSDEDRHLKTCLRNAARSDHRLDGAPKRSVTFFDDANGRHRNDLQLFNMPVQRSSKFLHSEKVVVGLEVIPESDPVSSLAGATTNCGVSGQTENYVEMDSAQQQCSKSGKELTAMDDLATTGPATPCLTVARVPSVGVPVPVQNVPKTARSWHIDIPMPGFKEKLTRRQMIQLGAAMGLGFILVLFILLWVFSPVLF